MGRADRGWAQRLLTWEWRGVQLVAEISRCAYYVRPHGREVIVWAEVLDLDGRRRCEIGSFPSVALARAACELDAAALCRREAEDRPPVDVRIARGRRRPGKGRELAAAAGDIDGALAAVAWATEDEGQ